MKFKFIIILSSILFYKISFPLSAQDSLDSVYHHVDTTNPAVTLSESLDLFSGIDFFRLFHYESYLKPSLGINVANRSNYLLEFIDHDFTLYENYQIFPPENPFYSNLNLMFSLENNAPLYKGINFFMGYLISLTNQENDFLLNIEKPDSNLIKQLSLHKQSFMHIYDDGGYIYQCAYHTYDLTAFLKKSLKNNRLWSNSISLRDDRQVFKSINYYGLEKKNINKYWLGLKTEFFKRITDPDDQYLLKGMNYKLYAAYLQQVNNLENYIFIIGATLKHNKSIYRTLSFAYRIAYGSSFGSNHVLYHLGGIDNILLNNNSRNPIFVPYAEIPVDMSRQYSFQTTVTPLRGYSNNIRNGNNYAVINAEIRWYVFKNLVQESIFLNPIKYFQLAGFFDIGSAWIGLTPFEGKNSYDNDYIDNGIIKITVDSNNQPIVMGTGFGLSTRVLGHTLRFDWAWGIADNQLLPALFIISLNSDF